MLRVTIIETKKRLNVKWNRCYYYIEYSDNWPSLFWYNHNASADMSFNLLQVFHVGCRSPHRISNWTLYLNHKGRLPILKKKAEGHVGRNIVSLIIKMRSIVPIFYEIMIIKFRHRNLDKWNQCCFSSLVKIHVKIYGENFLISKASVRTCYTIFQFIFSSSVTSRTLNPKFTPSSHLHPFF